MHEVHSVVVERLALCYVELGRLSSRELGAPKFICRSFLLVLDICLPVTNFSAAAAFWKAATDRCGGSSPIKDACLSQVQVKVNCSQKTMR